MDRDNLISRFQDIEQNTPIRKERLRKLDELYQSIEDNLQLSPEDIINLTMELLKRRLTVGQTFFSNVIYPILARLIESNNIEAIKLTIKLEQQLTAYQGLTKDYGYTAVELINKGLLLAPEDKELLQMYEVKTAGYLSYTIHEVPVGIIYEENGATIEQCDELLELVDDYEKVCKRLDVDRSDLIEDCRYFYSLYKEYLKVYSNYSGFKDYLIKNKYRTT